MKRTHILASGLVLLALLGGAAVQPEPASETQAEHPQAAVADVESIDAILNAWYTSIAGPRGQARDWERWKSLYLPEGRLISTRRSSHGGTTATTVISAAEYAKANDRYLVGSGFIDTEIGRHVDQFGNIAQVFSSYASRRDANEAEPYSRGVNSIQLVFDGERWWIASVTWDREDEDHPIPDEYQIMPTP